MQDNARIDADGRFRPSALWRNLVDVHSDNLSWWTVKSVSGTDTDSCTIENEKDVSRYMDNYCSCNQTYGEAYLKVEHALTETMLQCV